MKEDFIQRLKAIYTDFTEKELNKGLDLFELKQFDAKEVVLKAGKVCDLLYFPNQSISRCFYFDKEGEEQTLWMKPEKTFITEYKSFVHQEPSGFNLQFYEDTYAYCITRSNLKKLYSESIEWAQFGVLLTEQLHITLIDVFVNLLANDATRNYEYIAYAFPRFIQVAPLKDIASMLQISPVSLSRIRSGKQTKK